MKNNFTNRVESYFKKVKNKSITWLFLLLPLLKSRNLILPLIAIIISSIYFFTSLQSSKAAPINTTWVADYFNNRYLEGSPTFTETISEINFNWDQGSPHESIQENLFSARFTGTINVSGGRYRFATSTDDGVRVYVDGNLIIDDWNEHLEESNTVDIDLNSGTHTVVMEYFETFWVATAKLSIIESPFDVIIGADVPGVRVVIDGEPHDTPYALAVEPGESYSLYAPSPQTTSDGKTVTFNSWSNGGDQEQTITPSEAEEITILFSESPIDPLIWSNGFEEGNTSAYPQETIDVAPGNSLEVTDTHPRTGNYSLEISTAGANMPSVIDHLFPKVNTIYHKIYVSLPSDFELEPGAGQNAIIFKTDDFRSRLTVVIGSDYRIQPVYNNSNDDPIFPGFFGPSIPRDGSWHEIQSRMTVDDQHGQLEIWLDGEKIVHFTEIDTGIAGRDDIHVTTWGSYFSTPTNQTTMFFDDVSTSTTFIGETAPVSEGFETNIVASGFFAPTYAAFLPDGRILVAEKRGVIKVVKDGEVLDEPLIAIPNVNEYSDRGLLSIAVDPDFENNNYIYAAYTYDSNPTDYEGIKTARVIRLTVEGDTADMSSAVTILGTVGGDATNPSCEDYPAGSDCLPSDGRTHTIGGMQFLSDGTLLVSQGEGAPDQFVNELALRAQNLDSLAGKIIRINTDGTAPANNPFFNGNPQANRSKVWAYGFRNPFRFGVNPTTGRVYAGDVGWGTWEEINVVRPGENYGWPCYEGNIEEPGYSAYQLCQDLQSSETATFPIHIYPHPPSSAVVGGTFYTGTSYPSQYQNAYFFGDYGQSSIWTLRTDSADELLSDSVEVFPIQPDGPVQIFSGPNDDIYFLSIYTGQLRRVSYVTNGLAPIVSVSASPTSGPLALPVQFSSEGTYDPDGLTLFYNWNFGDGNTSTDPNPSHTYTTAGTYVATLEVMDLQGNVRSNSIVIHPGNSAPSLNIESPENDAEFTVGETVNFSASAIDPEDGILDPSAISWRLIMHHCEITTNTCHTHPYLSGSGNVGSFVGPDHGEGTFMELEFRVQDSGEISVTRSVFIHPNRIEIALESNPSGATVVLNGREYTTPAVAEVTTNGTNSLYTPSPQTIDGTTYNFFSWSNGQGQNHTLSFNEPTTIQATFIQDDIQTLEWNSFDVQIEDGEPQATITDENGNVPATLEFYESTNANGVEKDVLFSTFVAGNHGETFNNLDGFWIGPSGGYPYIGKSSTPRGSESGETTHPSPSGVFDLQMHPPADERLTVAAFRIPENGNYSVTNLSIRKILSWGGSAALKVFDNSQTEVALIESNGQAWSTLSEPYNLGDLTEGDYIYFTLDGNEDFVGDAVEIAFNIRALITTTQSVEVNHFDASPENINAGESSVISWDTNNATSINIDNGVGAVGSEGSTEVQPNTTTTYTITASNESETATASTTITVNPVTKETNEWNSYNIEIDSLTSTGHILSEEESVPATLEFYESTNANGVEKDVLFSTFVAGNHGETFNNLDGFWIGPSGGYPYIGKSSTPRGSESGETTHPSPSGVFDLQMHPPADERLTVAAFRIPENGNYSVTNLSIRKILSWGGSAALKVFDNNKGLITTITSNLQSWNNDPEVYQLGLLSEGDLIYFAVDNEGDFIGDAVEINWNVTREDGEAGEPQQYFWDSYDIEISSSSAQAVINDNTGSLSANINFYESTNDDGVEFGSLFPAFTSGNHPGAFNNLLLFWSNTSDGYPYIGKSSTPRGSDTEESNTPEPVGVFDLQMHPPANSHLVVSSFETPIDGEYSISNLGVRRVLPWGSSVTLKIFNNSQEEVASLTSLGLAWSTDSEAYSLGTLSAGDRIYIAIDGNEDFIGDASEVTFRITNTQ